MKINADGQWFRALDGAWKGEGKPLVCTGPNCPACVLTGEKWSLRRRIAFRTAFLWRAFRSDGFVYGYGGALISNAWGWQRAVLIVFAVMVYGEILEHRKIVRKQRRGA